MNQATVKMVISWLNDRDEKQLSKWMSKTLHLGTPKQCLALIVQAKQINQENSHDGVADLILTGENQ